MLANVCNYIVLVVVLEHCEAESSYMLVDVCNYIVLVVVLEHWEPESFSRCLLLHCFSGGLGAL